MTEQAVSGANGLGLDGMTWCKSTFSGHNENCVEVAQVAGWIAVRDSKDRGGAVLTFPATAWGTFIAGAKAGEFDLG